MLLPKPTVRNSSRATAHDAPKSAENPRPRPVRRSPLRHRRRRSHAPPGAPPPSPCGSPHSLRSASLCFAEVSSSPLSSLHRSPPRRSLATAGARLSRPGRPRPSSHVRLLVCAGESFLSTSLSPSHRSSNPWSAIVSPTQPSQRHRDTLRARQPALRPGSQPQPAAPSPLRSSPSHGAARVAAASPSQPAAVARPRPLCPCSSEPAQTSETTFPIRAAPALSWSSRPCRVSDPPPAVSCTSNRARAAPRHAIAAASCN